MTVTTTLPSHNLSLWQRLLQYQPTSRLVKILLYWWFAVVLLTAIDLTNGFGIVGLQEITTAGFLVLQAFLAVLAGFCVLDVLILWAVSQVDNYRLQREYPSNVAIFHPVEIKVLLSFIPEKLTGLAKTVFDLVNLKKIKLEFFDDYPEQLSLIKPMPFSLSIELLETSPLFDDKDQPIAQAYTKQIIYPTQPTERGTGYFGAASLRITSLFGLFRRQLHIAQTQDDKHADHYLRVLADFTGLLTDELSAVFEKSFDAGVQTMKDQGQGSEFLKLREYAVGDSMRQIDWKASSRQGRIMSKSYEDENDQDVLFLLDCSEQMRHKESNQSLMEDDLYQINNPVNELNYFDKVLNAVLLLSYVANKQGDRVGLMTFGGIKSDKNRGGEKFIPPQKGVSLIRHLLNETADIMPTLHTSDYFKAAEALKKSIKKRSLVIVITNTRQEASDELVQAMQLLSKKHQLVFANLIEQPVQDILDQKTLPMTMDDALLYHSLSNHQQTRHKLHQLLRQQTGAMCLSTTAKKLPFVLTQAYLLIKNK